MRRRNTWLYQLATIGGKGAEARRAGLGRDACPYAEGYRNANGPGGSLQSQRRKAWLEGWASADCELKEKT